MRRNLRYDLTGQRFGRLAVISYVPSEGWLCQCDCGTEKFILSGSLRSGTISCGCFRREKMRDLRTKHGYARSSIYTTWLGMKKRCENTNDKHYADYGGRGIKVCDRWQDFANFLEDMGPRPSPNLTLERIDNDGPYSKKNCKWATATEQANNKRNNRVLEFNGRKMTVHEWARELDVHASALHRRLGNGWSVEDTLSRPLGRMISFNGRTQSLQDWAKEIGVSTATIHGRRKRGWPLDKVLSAPKQVVPTILEFQGRKQTLALWAKELGIRAGAIHSRLSRGLSVDEALSRPIGRWPK